MHGRNNRPDYRSLQYIFLAALAIFFYATFTWFTNGIHGRQVYPKVTMQSPLSRSDLAESPPAEWGIPNPSTVYQYAGRWGSAIDDRGLPLAKPVKIVYDGFQNRLSFLHNNSADPMRWFPADLPAIKSEQEKSKPFSSCKDDQPSMVLELAGGYRTFDKVAAGLVQWLDAIQPPVCWAVSLATYEQRMESTESWWLTAAQAKEKTANVNKEHTRSVADSLRAMEGMFRGRLTWAVVRSDQSNTKEELRRTRQVVLWAAAHEMVFMELPPRFRQSHTVVFKGRPDAQPNQRIDLTSLIATYQQQPLSMMLLMHRDPASEPAGWDPLEVGFLTTRAGMDMVLLQSRITMFKGGTLTENSNAWERIMSSGPGLRTAFGHLGFSLVRFDQPDTVYGNTQKDVVDLGAKCKCWKARCYFDHYGAKSSCKTCGGLSFNTMLNWCVLNTESTSCEACYLGEPFINCDRLLHQWINQTGIFAGDAAIA